MFRVVARAWPPLFHCRFEHQEDQHGHKGDSAPADRSHVLPTDARSQNDEQPGDQEDHAGQPFVGPSGQLLDEVLNEVGIDRDGQEITVREVCEAFECGPIQNPDNLTSQVQGCIIMGMGPALGEAIHI